MHVAGGHVPREDDVRGVEEHVPHRGQPGHPRLLPRRRRALVHARLDLVPHELVPQRHRKAAVGQALLTGGQVRETRHLGGRDEHRRQLLEQLRRHELRLLRVQGGRGLTLDWGRRGGVRGGGLADREGHRHRAEVGHEHFGVRRGDVGPSGGDGGGAQQEGRAVQGQDAHRLRALSLYDVPERQSQPRHAALRHHVPHLGLVHLHLLLSLPFEGQTPKRVTGWHLVTREGLAFWSRRLDPGGRRRQAKEIHSSRHLKRGLGRLWGLGLLPFSCRLRVTFPWFCNHLEVKGDGVFERIHLLSRGDGSPLLAFFIRTLGRLLTARSWFRRHGDSNESLERNSNFVRNFVVSYAPQEHALLMVSEPRKGEAKASQHPTNSRSTRPKSTRCV
mmetsp:Transcript_22532/g.42918  ORF Transcript_22532/g.42918 Transcript_22532/m.42918 type:complete len:389 (-) Transcript_22532:75-1241(-)